MIINAANIAMLKQAYSAAFKKGFAGFGDGQDWSRIASQVPSTGKENLYAWLGHFAQLREWVGDRKVKNLAQHDYSIKNRKFESTIAVAVDDIEDDQYGVYGKAFEGAGDAAKVWPDNLVFEAAGAGATGECYDGQPFFDANHPVGSSVASNYDDTSAGPGSLWFITDNTKPLLPFLFQLRKAPQITVRMDEKDPHVFDQDEFKFGIKARGNAGYGFWQLAYGSLNSIDGDNLDEYIEAMMAYTSDEGYKLGVRPKLLVCGPSRRGEAMDLLERQLVSAGESNRHYKSLDLLVTPYLT